MTKKKDKSSLFSEEGNTPLEEQLTQSGILSLCGVDEAGRGPLAGPVVAGAVVFEDCDTLWSCGDSKALSAKRREDLYERITQVLAFSVGICDVEEIEKLNILQASLRAMEKAVYSLSVEPSFVLVDGSFKLHCAIPSRAIIHGDARVAVIGAASIIAKVTRDRLMVSYDQTYPEYGFAKHFGYPTQVHREAIKKYGPCPIHRKTFHGVKEYLQLLFRDSSDQFPSDSLIGKKGEDEATKYLQKEGYHILNRNWKCSIGEMDIICRKNGIHVFVEVKTSLKQGAISPEYRVNHTKQRKLHSLAKYYLKHVTNVDQCRFDVIAVWWEEGIPKIKHIQNAF